jgi:malate dehydrogenase (oxaloacetate-decarboxylating)
MNIRRRKMNYYEESLKLHEKYKGKLKVEPKVPCENASDLSVAYTPGVAQPCLEIQKRSREFL